jgi:hypothetical protein
MKCVTTARYAVRVNGELTSPVVSFRGIQQVDLISPYIFLSGGCTEISPGYLLSTSGKKINLQKSSLFFGNCYPDKVKMLVKSHLEVDENL